MFKNFRLFILASVSIFSITACGTQNDNLLLQEVQTSSVNASNVQTTKFNTAKESLWRAESDARRWDISSELVKVEGRDVREDGSTFGGSGWVYYFKSPFKRNVLRVDSWGHSGEVPNSFFGREIREFDWEIDSNKAIEIAKKQGLKSFPVIEMTLENRFSSAEWELRTYNGIFRINAETGKLSVKKK